MPDERTRIELAEHFRRQYGADHAAYLMEVIPPFSWSEIATKTDLRDLEARLNDRIDHLSERIDLRFESVTDKLRGEFQRQTNRTLMWLLPVVVAAIVGASALN
ncbi:MAG: hypothetical protein H0V95_01785 [Actinobacteria bacterium]|nr:hypothetical protein [Actinomycetota bacterium]